MRKIMIGFAFAAALGLCGGSAFAADQKLVGKKLLIKNPGGAPSANNKIVFLSKDTSIAQPSGVTQDPRCTPTGTAASGSASAVLTVTGSDSFSIPLTCDNWTVNGGGTLFKYKDTTGATCTIVLVKDGTDGKTYLAKNCTTAPVLCGASPSGAFVDVASLF